MEVQVHGNTCCFNRLYEVWYRSLSIPWLSIAAINKKLLVFTELLFNQPNAQLQCHRLSSPLVKTPIL